MTLHRRMDARRSSAAATCLRSRLACSLVRFIKIAAVRPLAELLFVFRVIVQCRNDVDYVVKIMLNLARSASMMDLCTACDVRPLSTFRFPKQLAAFHALADAFAMCSSCEPRADSPAPDSRTRVTGQVEPCWRAVPVPRTTVRVSACPPSRRRSRRGDARCDWM